MVKRGSSETPPAPPAAKRAALPGPDPEIGGAGAPKRTLTRSSRQGGLLETLIMGDELNSTVRRLWDAGEDKLLREAVARIGA